MNITIVMQLRTWFVEVAQSSERISKASCFSSKLCENLAQLLSRLGRIHDSVFLCEQGIKLCRSIGIAGQDLAILYLLLGRAHGNSGNQDGALQNCKIALEISDDSGEEALLQKAGILRTMAAMYRKQDLLS